MNKNNYTIAVLGTQNPVGKAILSELERQGYPASKIRPLDLHQESGVSFGYQNQTLTSSALDLFDLTQPHILFLCEPRIFERYPHHFLHGKNWLIDCTGKLKKAACIVPALNAKNIHCACHKCLCAPNSASIALAQALVPIDSKYSLLGAHIVALMGAWYQQPNLADLLIQQTRHFFTQTTPAGVEQYPILAFNLIPDFFHNLEKLIIHQMHCFLKADIQIHTCFAPVIRGGTFFIEAFVEKKPHINGIKNLYVQNSLCQFLNSNLPLGTQDLRAEDKLFIQSIQIHKNTIRFWLMQDPLQTGFIQNAVQILSLLIK